MSKAALQPQFNFGCVFCESYLLSSATQKSEYLGKTPCFNLLLGKGKLKRIKKAKWKRTLASFFTVCLLKLLLPLFYIRSKVLYTVLVHSQDSDADI